MARERSASAECLRQGLLKLRMLERACLALSRVSERELALVLLLLADQHAELRHDLNQLKLQLGLHERRPRQRERS